MKFVAFHPGSYSGPTQFYGTYAGAAGNFAIPGGGNLGTYDREDDDVGSNIGERDDARKYRKKSVAIEQGTNAGRYDERYDEKEYEEYGRHEQEPDERYDEKEYEEYGRHEQEAGEPNEQDDEYGGDERGDDDGSYPPGLAANVGDDNSPRERKKISKGDVLSTNNPDIRNNSLYKSELSLPPRFCCCFC